RCRARHPVVPRVPRRAADRGHAVHPGPRRLTAGVPVRAARGMADRRAARRRARLHGADRAAPRSGRHRRRHRVDREPPVSGRLAADRGAAERSAARMRGRAMTRRKTLIGGGIVAVVAAAALWLAWPDVLEPAEIAATP